MSLAVKELCCGIKSLKGVSRQIIQQLVMPGRLITLPLCNVEVKTHYRELTKNTVRFYSDFPRNKASLAKKYKCLICGKDHFDEKSLNVHLNRCHVTKILEQLRNDPLNTYKAIFGNENYKGQSSGQIDFKNALTVTMEGKYYGMWKCWTDGKYGGPIKAIMRCNPNFTYAQAVEAGAKIANRLKLETSQRSENDSLTSEDKTLKTTIPKNKVRNDGEHRILAAQNIWQNSRRLKGSLAEKYLVDHRSIPPDIIPRLAFKFLPRDTLWSYTDYNNDGEPIQMKNYTPALVVPVKNIDDKISAVQRIFLDKDTGAKSKLKNQVKYSKGVIRGGAGIVQYGQPNELLFIAEGPETGASVASVVNEKCTVLASLSIMNYDTMADIILSFKPTMVILAADNDTGKDASHETLYHHAEKLEFNIREQSTVPFKIVMPDIDNIPKENADWNDILVLKGLKSLQDEFWHKINHHITLT